jgi:quinol monooxygenase YgiN
MAKKKTRQRSGKKRSRSAGGKSRNKSRNNGKLPKDAVTLAVILRPREGQGMMLEAELRALIGPTRKEEGCLRYDLHRSVEGPGAFLLHEIWETREHHTAHTKTDHFLRWNARKDALLASREVGFWKQIV